MPCLSKSLDVARQCGIWFTFSIMKLWVRFASNYCVRHSYSYRITIWSEVGEYVRRMQQSINEIVYYFPTEERNEKRSVHNVHPHHSNELRGKLVSLAATQTEQNWNLVKTKLGRSTKQFSICVVRPSTVAQLWHDLRPKPKRLKTQKGETWFKPTIYPIPRKNKNISAELMCGKTFLWIWATATQFKAHTHTSGTCLFSTPAAIVRPL